MSKRFGIFLRILLLLAVFILSAYLYAPFCSHFVKTVPWSDFAYKAVTCLLIGAIAGGLVKPESGKRGLYVFLGIVFVILAFLSRLNNLSINSTLIPGIAFISEYAQAGFLLSGLFFCLSLSSRRKRSA